MTDKSVMDRVIVSATIRQGTTALDLAVQQICGSQPGGRMEVIGTFDDGSTLELFSYYAEELRFTEAELTGLTVAQAWDLHYRRDVAWLQS